jgi:hypothetical protein
MSNLELIDDYLTNRLNELERKSFEQQMSSDPTLKADVELQKEIIQGLKQARAAELKAMLNKVPVATPTFYLSPLRIAAGLIGTAVLATGLYLYYDRNGNFNTTQISSSLVDSIRQTEDQNSDLKVDSTQKELSRVESIDKKENNRELKKQNKPVTTNTKENKPAIDLLDPTEELTGENEISPEKNSNAKSTISVAKIEVNVNSSEKKFKSHYQFVNGKLILYGNFDSGLYEIIEVNAQESRSLFLYYKTAYYLLDEAKTEITILKAISDPVLIQKIKTFRSN